MENPRRLYRKVTFVAWLGVVCGCAAAPDNDPRPLAKDPVCLYHRDFACVNLRVDESTPRIVHLGKTYYFCNEECGEVFQANPEKYLTVMKK